jgi:hypothetical protein
MSTLPKAMFEAVILSVTKWSVDQIRDRIFRKTALNKLTIEQIKLIFRGLKERERPCY